MGRHFCGCIFSRHSYNFQSDKFIFHECLRKYWCITHCQFESYVYFDSCNREDINKTLLSSSSTSSSWHFNRLLLPGVLCRYYADITIYLKKRSKIFSECYDRAKQTIIQIKYIYMKSLQCCLYEKMFKDTSIHVLTEKTVSIPSQPTRFTNVLSLDKIWPSGSDDIVE